MLEKYYQYTFILPENTDRETIITLLSDYDFEGFLETDNGFVAYIPINKDNQEWLNILEDLENITFSKEIIEPKNWNEEWEKNYDVAVINDECEIYAPFHTPKPNILYPIFIEPKMSFGTGHHPTTFMMCNLLFEFQNEITNKDVIDVGCGTGILAILSKKLGAHQIFAIDNDPICIENTLENIQKNIPANQHQNFVVLTADIHQLIQQYPDKKFDIIIANIQKNVILNDLPAYKTILNKNGLLFLSGLLQEYEEEIIDAAKPLQHLCTKKKNEWIAMAFRN